MVLSRLREARLALAWHRGRRHRLPPEAGDPVLVDLAHRLQARSVEAAEGAHADSPHRLLLCTPPSWAAEAWFGDLEQGLRHMGVACERLAAGSVLSPEALWRFRPTVVVALDETRSLSLLPLEELAAYRRQEGCLRLFVPTRTDLFGAGALDAEEARRLAEAVAGRGADAFVSLYEPELYASHWGAWAAAGLPYLSLPQAANPLQDTARCEERVHAWSFCSVNNPARLRSVAPLRPLLQRVAGDWAGVGWSFGHGPVPLEELPVHHARARVVLAPLVGFLCDHPAELTHRVFEAAACGAFQLTFPTPITRRYFPEEALVAVPPEDFSQEVLRWLGRPEERSRVAEAALAQVYAHHTVFHRVERLLAWLDEQVGR